MYRRVARNLATVMATAVLSLPVEERQGANERLLAANLDLDIDPITGELRYERTMMFCFRSGLTISSSPMSAPPS